jgi:hypothetical protein
MSYANTRRAVRSSAARMSVVRTDRTGPEAQARPRLGFTSNLRRIFRREVPGALGVGQMWLCTYDGFSSVSSMTVDDAVAVGRGGVGVLVGDSDTDRSDSGVGMAGMRGFAGRQLTGHTGDRRADLSGLLWPCRQ